LARLLEFVLNPEIFTRAPWNGVTRVLNMPVAVTWGDSSDCPGCKRAKAYRLPVHKSFFEGRSDFDWYHSILAYLEFRAGSSWRPVRHRGACVAQAYRDAIRLVTLAFNGQLEAVSPALSKKPPVSVFSSFADSADHARGPLTAIARAGGDR